MSLNKNSPSLLIIYDYFFPGYKAGGPIQSLQNIVQVLEKKYIISLITSAHDLHEKDKYPDVKKDDWNAVKIPGCECSINVWYASYSRPGFRDYYSLIKQVQPAFVYLNGIFSYHFFILPLIALQRSFSQHKIVICPRGMLQAGALSGGRFKKYFYINILRLSGLLKNISWHATSTQEINDIHHTFGNDQQVQLANNIPKKPLQEFSLPVRNEGSLSLVYLSLIAEKKNLLLLLQLLDQCDNVTLDIYGPVKDHQYWNACEQFIEASKGKIKYMGSVEPAQVQSVFKNYHASILLTKGENFGHAIYESLSAGRPVITSYFTQWKKLKEHNAGWNVDISSPADIIGSIKKITALPSLEFNEYCMGAYKMSLDYYNGLNSIVEYTALFS